VDPLTDFPPEANCLEAYKINVGFPYGILSTYQSENEINVEVFDHQGLDTIDSVTVEAPDCCSGEVELTNSSQTSSESWMFSGSLTNEVEVPGDTIQVLVKVTDTESDPNMGAIEHSILATVTLRMAGRKHGVETVMSSTPQTRLTQRAIYTQPVCSLVLQISILAAGLTNTQLSTNMLSYPNSTRMHFSLANTWEATRTLHPRQSRLISQTTFTWLANLRDW